MSIPIVPKDGLCPKCGEKLERRENQFYWRQYHFPGLVCVPCAALYEDPERPFLRCVAELSLTRN